MKGEAVNKPTKTRSRKTVLVMRTCSADMTSYGGFRWPKRGPVSAPDWIDNYECGNGLHGWLWGEGDVLLDQCDDINAKWLVVRVLASEVRHGQGHMIGKCKFPRGYVVHCGNRKSATEYIMAHGAAGKAVICATVTAGDRGTAVAGYLGTATVGNRGTAMAGDRGTAVAGYLGTATVGDRGTAKAGDRGTAVAGYRGTAMAGYLGTATVGDEGTATVGCLGTAVAGHRGTAVAGNEGTATTGYRGTAMAGDRGILQIGYYTGRFRIATAYVGENGIKPNIKYRLDDAHNFVEVI